MTGSMGAWLKLAALVLILALSYVLTSLVLFSVAFLAAYLRLYPTLSTSYTVVTGDLLDVLSAIMVLAFFTFPATLSMFGHGGAWVKHVLAKSVKGLSAAFGATVLLYLGAMAASTIQFAPNLTAVSEPLAILASAGVLVLGLLSRGTLLKGAEGLVEASFHLASQLSSLVRASESMATIELQLTSTRQIREKSEEKVIQEEALRFQRFARGLSFMNCTTEFKLSFRERRGRVLLLARGRGRASELEQRLLSVAKTYLADARPAPADPVADVRSHVSSVLLRGAPEAVPNPLEPLARFFLENGFEGEYAVVLRHRVGNPLSKVIARREQRRLARDAAEQKSTESLVGDQTSTSTQDHFVQIELDEAVKKVERRASSQSIEAWVYLTGHGKTPREASKVAEAAAEVIRSSLSSHRKESELKVSRQRRPFVDLLPRGRPSVILPSEAAPLVWVPQIAIGMEVAPTVEFELPPALEGEIELGMVVLQSGDTRHAARVPLDTLPRHVFVTGMTGSGKTTSCLNLLLQLYQHGVPFLVIEPVKSEYRALAPVISGLQVFTVGDEETAPFRLNIFEPPSGVSVRTHVENLEAVWNSSFVMYAPLPYVIKQVLFETYKACGWDIGQDKRGRPITLDDFEMVAQGVARKLGYEPNVTMDIEAALRARITNLSLGSKRAVFNTASSIPLELILRRPTVIELKHIPNNEEKAFVTALLLTNLAEYLEVKGESKQLKHLTLIEEAHRLLPNISTSKGDPEAADPRKTMVEQFANMLAEVRAYGEGLAIVEQIPTKILPDAIKNTTTKIAHRVPAADDREVLAGAMNLTQEQMSVFAALQPGEAIVSLQKHPLPIRIAVPNVAGKLGLPVGEIGDGEVKRLMTDFYLRNPLPRTPQSALNEKLLQTVEADWFRTRFRQTYNEWLETGSTEQLANLLIQSAEKVSDDREETFLNASKFLWLAAERHLRFNLEKNEFPTIFMRSIERSMRNAKGTR